MTSEREGFPNAVLEALEAGLPTVMFKCHEGLNELIQDGINGFLIEQDDVQGYIDNLDYLINNPNVIADMSRNTKTIRKQYNKETVLGFWEKCIKSLIKQ